MDQVAAAQSILQQLMFVNSIMAGFALSIAVQLTLTEGRKTSAYRLEVTRPTLKRTKGRKNQTRRSRSAGDLLRRARTSPARKSRQRTGPSNRKKRYG